MATSPRYAFIGVRAKHLLDALLERFQNDPQLRGLSPGPASKDSSTHIRVVSFTVDGSWASLVKSLVCSFNSTKGDLIGMFVVMQQGQQPAVSLGVKCPEPEEEEGLSKAIFLLATQAALFQRFARQLWKVQNK